MLIAGLVAVGLVAAGCGGGDTDTGTEPTETKCSADLQAAAGSFEALGGESRVLAQAKKTVKLGFIGDLTGATSNLVIHEKQAAQLAIEQANAKGDLAVRIELVPLDNKDAVKDTAAPLAQQLANDPAIVGMIGPAFSGESFVADKILDEAGIAIVTPSATNPDLSKQGWKTFHRALSTDQVQGEQTGDLLVKGMNCQKVAVIDDKTDYGAGLGEIVEQSVTDAGGEVVVREGIEKTTDYTTLVDTLLARKPDIVYYAGYQPETSLVVKQYRAKGGKAPVMTGDGSKDNKLITDAGAQAAEGVLVTCPCLDPNLSTDAAALQMAKDYKAKFGVEPGIYSAEGWDSAQIFIAAVKAAGADVTKQKVLDFVNKLKGFKGISKTFEWTPTGEVKEGTIHLYQAKSGKLAYLGPVSKFVG